MTEASFSAIWINGERMRPDALHLSARDRGFTLADGLFETMHLFHGTVFRLDRHLRRLTRGLAALGIPARSELRDWVLDAVDAAGDVEAGVRLTVTRGPGAAGVAPPADVRPTVTVTVNPLPAVPPDVYASGLAAHVASGRRNQHAMTSGLKTLAVHRRDCGISRSAARRGGGRDLSRYRWALLRGDVQQPVRADRRYARHAAGILWRLPGITREAVLELAPVLGVQTAERPFALAELVAADEAFLTSSLRRIAPLVRVGERPIGNGRPGDLTRRCADAYLSLVRAECGSRHLSSLDTP
jgi:branched-chain amino acid aminotransferase